jgi:hypothetical protein
MPTDPSGPERRERHETAEEKRMKGAMPRVLRFGCIGGMTLASAACQQGSDKPGNSSIPGAGANNAAAATPGMPATIGPPGNPEEAAMTATGPVALPSDAQLPQACQDYVRAVQACVDRGGSSTNAYYSAPSVRGTLYKRRTYQWPAWERAHTLERSCAAETTEVTNGC